ncbi:MAG: bestrophin family ion channel [Flavobacteriales bacterium]
MRAYDSRNWLKPVLQFHRADTFRKLLPFVVAVGLFSAAIAYVDLVWLKLGDDSRIKNLPLMHSLLGVVIGLLLVFRTNTAYDRWWEGRKLWGALVNVSRNLALKVDAIVDPKDSSTRTFFAKCIGMFATELRSHLLQESTRLELDAQPHPEIPDFDRSKHVPTQVAGLLQRRVQRMFAEKRISDGQLLALSNDVNQFLDICGACERIKNTPIPYSYTSFIKKFIVLYVLSLPLGYVFSLGWIAVPVVMFIFYVLGSLEIIAEEIEDPFGDDSNDLPMLRLSEVIARNARETLE